MEIKEKVSYIRGLMEGMNYDTSTNEGKLIRAIVDALDEMAGEVVDLQSDMDTMVDYVDELDYDLGELEEYVYESDDEDDYCDGDCDNCDEDCEYAEDEDDEFIEIECPKCGEKICFDSSMEGEKIICPACNETIETE